MNSIQNKGLLWDKCAQKGLFVNITANSIDKVKELFESIIDRFSNSSSSSSSSKTEDISLLNEQFIEQFKDELNKMNSFEARQKEYDEMLKTKPAPIDFTEPTNEIQNQPFIQPILPVQSQVQSQVDWGQVIKSQNDILIKILETQIKIMFMLQKK
jgi:hypothetical protein